MIALFNNINVPLARPTRFYPAPATGPSGAALNVSVVTQQRLIGLCTCLVLASALCGAVFATMAPAPPFTRCMNLSNALEASTEGDWGYVIRDSDIRRIAAAGFEAIRVPIKWSDHSGDAAPYTLSPVLLKRVDAVARAALDAGLQVIIDVHHFDGLMHDIKAQSPRLTAIWSQLSTHYASWPETLLFELINEPYSPVSASDVEALNSRLLTIIRRQNPRRWVVVGGAEHGSLDGLINTTPPPDDDRLLATFHYYTPFNFTHQGAAFMDAPPPAGMGWGSKEQQYRVQKDMARAAAYGARYQLPVLMGEFGVYTKVETHLRAHWIRTVRQSAEAAGLGWCHWGWGADFRAYDLQAEAWLPPITEALLEE